jgi:hypothetical protein
LSSATLTRLLPVACLIAALCLFASELMTIFEFTPPSAPTLDTQSGVDRHSYAIALLALFAVAALAIAVLTASKPGAIAVGVAGALALGIFLLVDLPDANAVGTLSGESGSFLDAQAVPAGGFWLGLLGSIALAVSGVALATLSPDQLASLRPGKRRRSPSGERRPGRQDRAKTKPAASETKPSRSEAAKRKPGKDARQAPKRTL